MDTTPESPPSRPSGRGQIHIIVRLVSDVLLQSPENAGRVRRRPESQRIGRERHGSYKASSFHPPSLVTHCEVHCLMLARAWHWRRRTTSDSMTLCSRRAHIEALCGRKTLLQRPTTSPGRGQKQGACKFSTRHPRAERAELGRSPGPPCRNHRKHPPAPQSCPSHLEIWPSL